MLKSSSGCPVDHEARATESPGCPVDHSAFAARYRPFDHEGMYEFWAEARREHPVFYSQEIDAWVVTRRDDVMAVFGDPESYSASNSQSPVFPFPPEVNELLKEGGFTREPTQANTDPPKHTRIRAAAEQFLNPRRYLALEPQIRALVQEHVDAMKGRDVVDIVDALTYELPARVVFLLMGAPDIAPRQLKKWSDNRFKMVWGRLDPEVALQAGRQLLDYWNFCSDLVDDRMSDPREDYPSTLLRIRDGDDEVLTINEIKSLVFGLLLAGHETTSNGMANLIVELLSTNQWSSLVEDPALIRGAVEEGLRFAPPFITWRRRTKRAVTLGGHEIPEGSTIVMAMSSANRDEKYYEDGETFDIRRRPKIPHMSFGHGIHFCMGAQLARLEIRVAIEELTRAFPEMTIEPDQTIDWAKLLSFRGPSSVRVRLGAHA